MKCDLPSIAKALVAPGKGILAADESLPTIEKRLKSIGVSCTEAKRRDYRELLFTSEKLGEYISGVILFDETIRQKSSAGQSFVEILQDANILPGIKVDRGAKPMANFPGEKVTEGLDGLRGRLEAYRELGARFTKWRAVITMGEGIPSESCIESNAEALARFAALSQEAELIPIVEPEVLMDGAHEMERNFEVTHDVLTRVFEALARHRIVLESMLLKPNMVLPGQDCPKTVSVEEAAEATVRCLKETVPAAVPGIVFLSGGQSDVLATRHLNAMNRLGKAPWELSFSYGRALQAPALKAWGGEESGQAAAQKALLHRAKCNHVARSGTYTEELETT